MRIILVPYFLDDHQPGLDAALPAGADIVEVAVDLPDADIWARLARLYDAVANTVASEVRDGSAVAVVSGDCTVSIGIAAGLQRAGVEPSIVWVDAHGDVQTLETTTSGFLGGMALRLLVGYRPDLLADRIGLRPPQEERVLLVDARDLDPPEVDYLASAGITRSSVDGLSDAALPGGPLLVNLDLDVVDPGELPGLRYPAGGGPDAASTLRAAHRIVDSGQVSVFHVACTWHPGQADPAGARENLLSGALAAMSAQ